MITLPPLADLLHWLSQMPDTLQSVPAGLTPQKTPVRELVSSLVSSLSGSLAEDDFLEAFEASSDSIKERNRLAWVQAGCHLLAHPSFKVFHPTLAQLRRFLTQDIPALSAVVPIDLYFTEETRREELLRRALRALSLTLPGENEATAGERLAAVDSVERRRQMIDSVDLEKQAERARQMEQERRRRLEEELRRRAEEEAASKYNRE